MSLRPTGTYSGTCPTCGASEVDWSPDEAQGGVDICGARSPESGSVCTEPPGHEGAHCGPDLRHPPAPGERHAIWACWA